MQEILARKLRAFIGINNPDVLVKLQTESKVTDYLKEKVASIDPLLTHLLARDTEPYFIEEYCMHLMTADLRPSRFNYIASVFEEEFEPVYRQFRFAGILRYEIINMVEACKTVFDTVGFNEANVESRLLRYATTGALHDYLENKKWN